MAVNIDKTLAAAAVEAGKLPKAAAKKPSTAKKAVTKKVSPKELL